MFEVINTKTAHTHGFFDTLDEARGCVEYDGLKEYQIWRENTLVEWEG